MVGWWSRTTGYVVKQQTPKIHLKMWRLRTYSWEPRGRRPPAGNDIRLPAIHYTQTGAYKTHMHIHRFNHKRCSGSLVPHFLGQVREHMGETFAKAGRKKKRKKKENPLHLTPTPACTDIQYMCSLSLPPPPIPPQPPSLLPLSITIPCLTTVFLPPTQSGSNTISCLIKFCCV